MGWSNSLIEEVELPSKVTERLVRLGHLDGGFTLGHGFAFAAVSSHELVGEFLEHRLALLAAAGIDQPADRQALLTFTLDGHGDLIVGTADSLGSDFQSRFNILDGDLEDLEFLAVTGLLLDLIHGVVKHFLRDGFLPLPHEAVDELGNEQ